METIKQINTQKVLAPTGMTLAPYAINPYRGCEFECLYCYARLVKNRLGKIQELGVKINAPQILEKELAYKKVNRVLLGSSCECFTYAERRFRVTEKILQVLDERRIPAVILTKSPLITDYCDILANNDKNKIFLTFNFATDRIKNIVEKNSPSLDKRREALDRLKRSGIACRAHIGPFIPFFSDLEQIFFLMAGKVKEIDIELYNARMGNFPEVLKAVKTENPAAAEKFSAIYKNEKNYYNFSAELKTQIDQLNQNYGYKVFYIVPAYNRYYAKDIYYE